MTEQTAAHTPGEWRYDIQYGPEGEAAYAWVYDAAGQMVGTMRTHQAAEIVGTMNAKADMLTAIKDTRAIVSDGALEGFLPLVGDWAERLFLNQRVLSAAISRAEGRTEPKAGE